MGRAAALGASSLAISTILTSADAIAADAPKNGGVLKLGLAGGSTTDSLDFRTTTDSVLIDTNHGLWNCLAKWGQDGRPHPELAESWEATNGAKDWIFKLRRGVTFSNGKEFTADDAIYSLNLHRGDTKSGGATSVKGVTDIKKLDDHQIQISLSAADADFPYGMTDYHLMMVPDGFKDWAKPVGTGPFVLENFDPGVRIRLKKTRPYWKEGKGLLDGVDVTVINDGSARLNALISGPDGRDQPGRSQGGRSPVQDPEDRSGARAGRLVLGPCDGSGQAALRQSRHPHGGDARRRSRTDAQGFVQRLRHSRQRSSNSADRPLLQ